ncbi:MAG: hypothetical protein F6J97_26935, partial [Leptolyngbya sp. SIO4C1]|nr:hypothetical protein [Leptolyngbya sp. SIO4C1]
RTDKSQVLHRRSLRDNLAAVQSMAIYHYKNSATGAGEFPLACLSTVVHPGTTTTQENSQKFMNVAINGANQIDVDFFHGYGTNAWEYGPPLGGESAFTTAYNSSTSPLKIALKNLAYFAGDPAGGAPSFTPVQDKQSANAVIHPYQTLSMWGDFSHLRRIFEPTATGGLGDPAYSALSPADKTYAHTAACTLGMLANNIKNASSLDYTNASTQTALASLATAVNSVTGLATLNAQLPHAYIAKLSGTAQQTARLLHLKEQIARDRRYGFKTSPVTNPQFNYTVTRGPHTLGGYTVSNGVIRLGVDPVSNNYFGFGAPTDAATERRFLQLAAVAGGLGANNVGRPKFPALY